MKVAKDCVVLIDYTLRDNKGEVLDSSEGFEPLAYIHGTGALIPGLERELEGRIINDSFQCTISPADGYGERNETLVTEVPKEQFESPDKIEVGARFKVDTGEGFVVLNVTAINDKTVTLDGNHPMAGIDLNFAVTVKGVREATADELKHGHAHASKEGCGGGGCGSGGCGSGQCH